MLKYYLRLTFLWLFCSVQINAQITDLFSAYTDKILIEDDYLYYMDIGFSDGDVLVQVRRTDLTAVLPSIEILAEVDLGGTPITSGLAKNGDYIYFGGHYFLGTDGPLYRLNISEASDPELLFSGSGYVSIKENDMAYRSNFLYRTEYSSFDVVRENVSLPIPLTSSVYLSFDGISRPKSLHIDGLILYVGLDNGDIYTKNLLLATPEELVYSAPSETIIWDIIKFEGYIYYATNAGVFRFDPLEVTPSTETIATSDDFMEYPNSLAAKSFDTGEKYLYVSDWGIKIVKIDLNDPTLSIKNTSPKKSIIYPNPTSDILTIKSISNIEKLMLYDSLGKLVLEFNASNQAFNNQLNISSLNRGVYNLKIKTGLGVEIQKIVKQ